MNDNSDTTLDVQQIAPTQTGGFTSWVTVNGTRLDYSAYRFPDGSINVGRITPPRVVK